MELTLYQSNNYRANAPMSGSNFLLGGDWVQFRVKCLAQDHITQQSGLRRVRTHYPWITTWCANLYTTYHMSHNAIRSVLKVVTHFLVQPQIELYVTKYMYVFLTSSLIVFSKGKSTNWRFPNLILHPCSFQIH